MGLIFIALSVGCSLSIAQILKLAERRKLQVLKILVLNYLAGFLISLFNSREFGLLPDVSVQWSPWMLVLLGVLGVLFISNMVVYSKSIDRVGMGVSIAAMRMSLIFPISISLFVFNEALGSWKYAGILLALSSLLLMVPRIRTKSLSGLSDAWLPFLIFMITGLADTGLKVYEQVYATHISEDLFVSIIFLISFIIGAGILVHQKKLHFSLTEIGYGVAAGIVNLYSSIFLIYALRLMPGSVVFPLINVSLVVLGTLIGIMIWKDTLSGKQWSGLVIAILSIFILLA